MSIISGLTPAISYLTQDEEGNPKTAEDYNENFKDYIFDYTDPVDIATLPLYALGPAGIAANRAIKAGRVANKAFKPSGIQSFLSKPGVNVGIPTATLAGDVTYDLSTDEEFMGDIKTIAGIEDDAQDEAQKDLEDVNKKEEEDKEKKEEDKELTPKEKGIAALAALAESFGDSQEYTSTPGYMIEGASISTPEIRRYAEGGIANLEPMMMSDGGIAKFASGSGRAGIFTRVAKTLSKKVADKKQKKADKAQEKADKAKAKADEAEAKARKAEAEAEETGITKDKPIEDVDSFIPPYVAMFGSKATDLLKQIPTPKRQVGRALFYGVPAVTGLSYGADALFGDDKKKPPTGGSNTAAVPEIEESDALLDIIRQTSLERAQAAGRTEPSFIDYLASFPSSYMEKVERDPEFARQMMAGFTAMTRTTEGFAPRNALTDFVQGVEAERIRQEDATPDQLKLIEAFAADPQLLESFTKFNRATNPLSGEELADDISVVASLIKESLYGDAATKKPIFKLGSTERGENTPLSDLQIYQLYQSATGTPSERLSAVIGMVEREA